MRPGYIALLTLLISASSAAQETAAGAPGGPRSRATIVHGDEALYSPLTIVTREEIAASGKASVADLLQQLPEQGNAANTQVNNGGDGSTRISLRGLGSQRTLVLLNGHRLPPGGNGADASVDLGSIPSFAVERVEILRAGGSALYGEGAVGGVVNVITRQMSNGAEASAYGGISQRGDGRTYDLSVTAGQSGDRGSAAFSAGYYNQQSVFAGERDFSKFQLFFDPSSSECPKSPQGKCVAGPGEILVGSGTIPAGRVVLSSSQVGKAQALTGNPDLDTKLRAYNALVTNNPKTNSFIACLPGENNPGCVAFPNGDRYRPYVGTGLPELGGDQYNFQPQNYDVTPAQRISLFSKGDLALGSSARGYYDAMFVNRQSQQLLAAEPLLTDGDGIIVSKDNLYNPFGVDIAGVRRRLVEFGNRAFAQDITTFRAVGGVDGKLPEQFGPVHGWSWDLSLNFGRTEEAGTRNGSVYLRNLAQALGPSMKDPKTGAPICVATAGDAGTAIPGCVPLNLFSGAAYDPKTGAATAVSITPDQVSALTFTGVDRGINQTTAVQANASGDLFSLFADRPAGLAFGYEYRLVYGAFIPDPITVAGETSGGKGLVTRGSYHENDVYANLSLPLVARLPFAEDVTLGVAARVFNGSSFGTDATYEVGGRWRPVHDFTVRGGYSTGFRAPAIDELYRGQQDLFLGLRDPCSCGGATPVEQANCRKAGVDLSRLICNTDDQTLVRGRTGGNPALRPETANLFNFGVAFEPRALEGASVSVDYYNILLKGTISASGVATILANCYPSDRAAIPRDCDKIVRDPVTQRIVVVQDFDDNVGTVASDGIEAAARYALPTVPGVFTFAVDGTWLHSYDVTQPNGTVLHGRGVYDLGSGLNGGVYPAFKANAGVTFSRRNLTVAVNERFIGSYWECADDSRAKGGLVDGAGLCNGSQRGHADNAREVDPYFQTDLYASYGVETGLGRTALAIGMNNAFNVAPPRVYNAFTPTSDPTAYDFMGRFFWGRVTQKF